MASLTEIRPQTTACSLDKALKGTGAWRVWTGGVGLIEPSQTIRDLMVTGVTVSTEDVDTDWVFVGVPGLRRHGAALSRLAAAEGATVVVTDEDGANLAADAGVPIIVVDNPRRAAGLIAHNIHSGELGVPSNFLVAGVTGTNGKTTTTYFLRAALASKLGKMGLLGTIEVDTGSFSTLSERTTHEAPVVHRALAATAQAGLKGAVVEVSSHAMSLDRVGGVQFDLGVFTNLQHDHLDFYDNSMDLYFEAKAQLFEAERTRLGVAAVDDAYGRRLVREATTPMTAVQVLTNDVIEGLDAPLWRVSDITVDPSVGGSSFTLHSPDGTQFQASCPIPGVVNVQDAALAIVGAHLLGVSVEDAISGVRVAPPVPGRMQWVPSAEHQPAVLIDYAHTPEALEHLLEDIRPLCSKNLVLVFGTDGDRDATKRVPLGEIAGRGADLIWVTDENPRWEDPTIMRNQLLEGIRAVRPSLDGVIEVTTSRRDAVREAIYRASAGDVVIISGKGAEPYQDYRGVHHHYMDAPVAREVLDAYINEPSAHAPNN
ncbi:Mur ligase family protein [Actinomyces minihominis]|uniref:Mur ligase family protein n=1 Tax=Actinomyces minihominis TaxID=2002838 RepID=UPI000C06B36D|nr:UDP-N-acetylmuramoyl-L-alanyl-D-glutamate--2,6-diaminopimelate ligase [Actinomyces minihominis]